MFRRELHPLLAVAVLGVVLAAGVSSGVVGADVLFCMPLLMLVLPLLAGRYLGEEQLERLVTLWRARRVRPARVLTARVRPRADVPRGGLLLGAALAQRGPPAVLGTR